MPRDRATKWRRDDARDGFYVNQSAVPTLVAESRAEGMEVAAKRNGLLGIGPFPTEDRVTPTHPAPANTGDHARWARRFSVG